ncbi:MAG: hemerythrin family protein [Rhodospirillales bacterium]|nr:hemerythrin family protein [Rhodospirillales bacterium]
MKLIKWNETMRLGVPEVDFEHEELIGVINALGDLLQAGNSPDTIQLLLGKIHAQIEGHFALEEKIMRDRGFVGYEAHKEDHDRLLEQIRDIMTEAKTLDEPTLRDNLAERLNAWFSDHFSTLDRSFHNHS